MALHSNATYFRSPVRLCVVGLLLTQGMCGAAWAQAGETARDRPTSWSTPVRTIPLEAEEPPEEPFALAATDQIDPPPLSIYEAGQSLRRAAGLMQGLGEAPEAAQIERIDAILRATMLYVEHLDRMHPTLPYYSWYEIDGLKVDEKPETLEFRPEGELPAATAIHLSVHHGDVRIHRIRVESTEGGWWDFNHALTIQQDQPRPEIFFLYLPTRIARVLVTTNSIEAQDHRPRLFVAAGISKRPELGKQAVYALKRSRDDLGAGRFENARRHLWQAYEALRAYQKDRRL